MVTSVARLALVASVFSSVAAMAAPHHGHPVMGMPLRPRPPIVVGIPVRPRPPIVVGLPVPRPPIVIGLPVPRPPVVIGVPVFPPPVVIPVPVVPPPVVIGLPAPQVYSLTCQSFQGTEQEILNVMLTLQRNGAESFRATGSVAYTAGGADVINTDAIGFVGGRISLRLMDGGDIQITNGAGGVLRPYYQGYLRLNGRTDNYGLSCTLVRQ